MGEKSPFRSLRLAWHRLSGRKTARLDGLTLTCDPALVPRSVATAIVKGSYEAPERALVRAALRPGDRVLEIGAGVGVVALTCARLVGAENVLSYEANAALEPVIRENFRLNGLTPNLRLRAISADGAPLRFFRNDNIVSSSVHDRGLDAQEITVPSDRIDAALAGHRATVLVMDIEGAETAILPAADLSGLREMIIELHPHIVGDAATEALIGAMKDRGFAETGRQHKNIRLSRPA